MLSLLILIMYKEANKRDFIQIVRNSQMITEKSTDEFIENL